MSGPTLITAAALTGILHTLLGPDHYLPFVGMGRAAGWSVPRTVRVALWCGVGHVGGSFLLGTVGLAAGVALFKLGEVEAVRARFTAWLLLGSGVAYFVWGLWRALKRGSHVHVHAGPRGNQVHMHAHNGAHDHVGASAPPKLGAWLLFTILVLGPCEPLIPLLAAPAAIGKPSVVAGVAVAFMLATLSTMGVMVAALSMGARALTLGPLARFGDAVAGLLLIACAALA